MRKGPTRTTTTQAASILGKKGGKVTSERKAKAVRENGKLGGRPKSLGYLGYFKTSITGEDIPFRCADPIDALNLALNKAQFGAIYSITFLVHKK